MPVQAVRCSTKEMRRTILDMYETHPPIVIAKLTGRSVAYIRCVASAMGIKSGGTGKNFDDYWTPAEEKLLSECYGRTMTARRLASHLGRTEAAIHAKASRLGIERRLNVLWTDADDAVMRKHYTANGSAFVAKQLNRTRNSIKQRARKLGLKQDCKPEPAQAEA